MELAFQKNKMIVDVITCIMKTIHINFYKDLLLLGNVIICQLMNPSPTPKNFDNSQ
jgi:hypothetical protein